jgi:hypothetical protein
LPLSLEDIETLVHDPDPRQQVIGLLAKSLHANGWHVSEVTDFRNFVRRLLGDPHTPDEIRNDQRLRKEFLVKKKICWPAEGLAAPAKVVELR